jgi:hypothetical protein
MSSDVIMQDLLAAVTDAIIAEEQDIDVVADRYDVPRKEANSLIHLIQRLHTSVDVVEPSTAFAHRLKSDLMGVKQTGIIWRWRRLPARVQIAAGVTLVGSFVLLITGFLTGNWRRHREVEEMKIA